MLAMAKATLKQTENTVRAIVMLAIVKQADDELGRQQALPAKVNVMSVGNGNGDAMKICESHFLPRILAVSAAGSAAGGLRCQDEDSRCHPDPVIEGVPQRRMGMLESAILGHSSCDSAICLHSSLAT